MQSARSSAVMWCIVDVFPPLAAFLLLNLAMSSGNWDLVGEDYCRNYDDCMQIPHTKACSCDRRTCRIYDNCCRVLPAEVELEPSEDKSFSIRDTLSCVALGQMPFIDVSTKFFFMVTQCPAGSDEHISALCRLHAEINNATFYQLPVTGSHTRIVYGNYYCALCNGERAVEYWYAERKCLHFQLVPDYETPEPVETVSDDEEHLVELKPPPQRVQFEDCHLSFTPTNYNDLHPCGFDSCSFEWNDTEMAEKCQSSDATLFVYTIHQPLTPYRNVHCARCNGLSIDSLTCDARWPLNSYPPHNLPLSVLINFNDQSNDVRYGYFFAGKKPPPCPAGEFLDPFRMMCVRKFCHPGLFAAAADDGDCQKLMTGEKLLMRNPGKADDSSSSALNCSVFIAFNKTEYILNDNNTLTILSRPDTEYLADEYFIDGSTAYVCSPFERSNDVTLPHDEALKLLTLIGVILSLMLLLMLFVVYLCFPVLRNTPGKCLMSLVTSLFAGELLLMFAVKGHNESHVICIGQVVNRH